MRSVVTCAVCGRRRKGRRVSRAMRLWTCDACWTVLLRHWNRRPWEAWNLTHCPLCGGSITPDQRQARNWIWEEFHDLLWKKVEERLVGPGLPIEPDGPLGNA